MNPSSQTVPQALLIQISTLPSAGLVPPTSLSVPSVQLLAGVEVPVQIHECYHINKKVEIIPDHSEKKADGTLIREKGKLLTEVWSLQDALCAEVSGETIILFYNNK